jgi:hypothetical protein
MQIKLNSFTRTAIVLMIAVATSTAMVSTAVSAAPQSLLNVVPVA